MVLFFDATKTSITSFFSVPVLLYPLPFTKCRTLCRRQSALGSPYTQQEQIKAFSLPLSALVVFHPRY